MNDLSRYAVDIDLANPNTSHAQLITLVGSNKKVLDVGCWTGDLGRALAGNGCTVSGLEMNAEAAAIARRSIRTVVVADLDRTRASEHFPLASFDAVVLGDVLEHVTDPLGTLRDVAQLLTPGGRVVVSIPNVTHGSVRLALLEGRWDYTATGLLDETHIRFYSRRSLLTMLAEAGYAVDELCGTTADPLGVEVRVEADRLPPTLVEWVRDQPDALVYQFLVRAHPAGPDEAVVGVDEPLRAIVPDFSVRAVDRHTERMRRDVAERQRSLAERDRIIELETANATAQRRAENADRELGVTHRKLRRQRRRTQELRRQVDELAQWIEEPPHAPETSVIARLRRRLRRPVPPRGRRQRP